MYARLRGSKSLLTLYQIINKPDFPSLADEIAEQHPDMNIKVATFTVSESQVILTYSLFYTINSTEWKTEDFRHFFSLHIQNWKTLIRLHFYCL